MKAKRILSMLTACAMTIGLTVSGGVSAFAETDLAKEGLDSDLRFIETRKITVEVFDRGQDDGKTTPEDNYYSDWIKEGMLRDHNVEVTFVPVPRWTEGDVLNNLLAAGDMPDIGITYSYPTIQTYANMGGVMDLAPYIDGYKDILPNMWDLLGEINLYYDKDPKTGTIWAIETLLFNSARINTFVREDWLNILELDEPTTLEEFEEMLYAFKDNAELLLGKDAAKLVPFSSTYDLGWRGNNMSVSFIPSDITEKDLYIHGYDDRQFTLPGYKEGIRKLNEWYNAGLMWNDFPLYGEGDNTEDNTLLKAGFVGAYMGNWDLPYRDGENGTTGSMRKLMGDDAAYIAVDCFQNDAGEYKKWIGSTVDRKIFFPTTNKEPLASMLYIDWISKQENRMFLQIGEEGVTHEVMEDGAIKTIATKGPQIVNSANNIDYTLTINGLDLGDPELTAKSMALGYADIDAYYIERALAVAKNDGFAARRFNAGEIKAEEGIGEALKAKRNALLTQAVVAKPDKFDSVYDKGFEDYLKSGYQAIIDERTEKWEEAFGDATEMP